MKKTTSVVSGYKFSQTLGWRVTITAYEDGEQWVEDYLLKIDADRVAEAARENGNSASVKRAYIS